MFHRIRERGYPLDPSCVLWFPFYRYGLEQSRIWDGSQNDNSGLIHSVWPDNYAMSVGYEGQGWHFTWKASHVTHTAINLAKVHTLHYWLRRTEALGIVHGGVADDMVQITDTTVGYSAGAGTIVAVSHNGDAYTSMKTLISIRRVSTKVNFYQNGAQIGVEQTMGEDNDLTLTDVGRDSDDSNWGFSGTIYEVAAFSIDQGELGVKNFFEMTRRIQGI
jgi:hypothetical protein